MMTVDRSDPRVFRATLTGQVTAEDVEAVYSALGAHLDAADGRIGMVLDLIGLTDATPEAMVADFRREMALLPRLRRIARVAILSDKAFIAGLTRWADKLVPGLATQVFASDQADAADAFAADLPPQRDHDGGVTIIEDTPDFLAWRIDGPIGRNAAQPLFDRLAEAADAGRHLDAMAVIDGYDGFDPAMLLDADLYRGKVAGLRTIRRYAIVGAPPWMEWAARNVSAYVPTDLRCFPTEAEARDWLAN